MRGVKYLEIILKTDNSELIEFSISSEPWILTVPYGVLILISTLISLSGMVYKAFTNGYILHSPDILLKRVVENYIYL